jgi:hypothetical protein
MRIWLGVGAVLLAMRAPLALADRDPNSGAPLPPPKHASTPSPITDHFYIKAAYFAPKLRTSLQVDPSYAPAGVVGTLVSGENTLGLPERLHEGRVEFMFRMRERSKVRLDYYEANRSGSSTLSNDIVFGNNTFAAGSLTQSTLNFQMGDLTYTYSFYRSDRLEIGTGIALYLIESRLEGAVPATFQSQTVTAAGPIPALPLDFTWRISSKFAFTARGAYLRVNIDGGSGWFDDLHADAQYRWTPNFVLGLGYSSIHTSVTSTKGSNPGIFDMSISGPEAFLRFSF